MRQNGKKVALFLADEQALFRQGLAGELSQYPEIEVVGEASSGEEVLAALEQLPPNVMVVCSLTLSPIQGLMQKIHQRLPAGSILALADVKDPEAVFQAACAGAEAILTRGTRREGWAQVIKEIHQGGHPIDLDLAGDPRVARRFMDESLVLFSRPSLTSLLTPLSPREEEVLRRLAEGRTLPEVSASLQVTPQALHRHLASIRRKLEVNTFTQEAVLALWGSKEEKV